MPPNPSLTLLPAVDILGGRAVQLVRGRRETATDFGDPVQAAARWVDQGASWLHIVDLDAAFGTGDNAPVIAQIVASTSAQVEVSGGLRGDTTLKRALGTGCARVSIGTAAAENPAWCATVLARYGDRITISLDVAGRQLATRGWVEASGDLYQTLNTMTEAGCRRFIVTDTASDGTLSGPNLEILRAVCGATSAVVIASGGISALDDIRALRGLTAIGLEGAIIGTALYRGEIDLPAALSLSV
jgi:phosphoribosylanthranilate isomerase